MKSTLMTISCFTFFLLNTGIGNAAPNSATTETMQIEYNGLSMKYNSNLIRKKSVIPVLEDIGTGDSKILLASEKFDNADCLAVHNSFWKKTIDDMPMMDVAGPLRVIVKNEPVNAPGFSKGYRSVAILSGLRQQVELRTFQAGNECWYVQSNVKMTSPESMLRAFQSALDSAELLPGGNTPEKKSTSGFLKGWWDGLTSPVFLVINIFKDKPYKIMVEKENRTTFFYIAGFVMGILTLIGGFGGSVKR